jgi:hypothetical protein
MNDGFVFVLKWDESSTLHFRIIEMTFIDNISILLEKIKR